MAMSMLIITLTEDEWDEKFQPETDEEGCLYVQRDWTNAADLPLIDQALAERRLWTMVEDDDGNMCIAQGYRRVNRLYYIICTVPYGEDEWVFVETYNG
jgi:hypothetical protein